MSASRLFAFAMVSSLVFGFVAIPDAEAHRQGLRPGYERMLYDCSHDWGWESGRPLDKGHELVTVDITEDEIDGTPMVLIELNLVRVSPSGFGANYQMLEQVEFSTPRASFSTTIDTTAELEAHFVSGDEPVYISERKTGMTQGGGEDEMLIAFDLGYTYQQLEIQNGEMITDFALTAYYQHFGEIIKGDVIPGGYYRTDGSKFEGCPNALDNDPDQDETHFVAIGYQVQNSTWSVPGSDPEEDADAENGTGDEQQQRTEPVPDFHSQPERPLTLESIRFEDQSFAPDGLTDHHWDFGDGNQAEGEVVEHAFERPGRYTVRMSAQTPDNEVVSVQKLVVVLNRAPEAAFEWAPLEPQAGEPVELLDRSNDLDGRIVSWEWRIPGIAERHVAEPTVTFPEPGAYEITLIVTDDWGAPDRVTKTILVAGDAPSDLVELPGPAVVVFMTLLVAAIAALRATTRRDS